MERIVINHQSNKERRIPYRAKEILFENYDGTNSISIHALQLDHIVPFCISRDNSLENLQLLKPREHHKKTKDDFNIIKKFRKKGWIEKITNYSHELKKSIKFLVGEYKKESQAIQDIKVI